METMSKHYANLYNQSATFQSKGYKSQQSLQ